MSDGEEFVEISSEAMRRIVAGNRAALGLPPQDFGPGRVYGAEVSISVIARSDGEAWEKIRAIMCDERVATWGGVMTGVEG